MEALINNSFNLRQHFVILAIKYMKVDNYCPKMRKYLYTAHPIPQRLLISLLKKTLNEKRWDRDH